VCLGLDAGITRSGEGPGDGPGEGSGEGPGDGPAETVLGPRCQVCAVPVADPRLPGTRRADALLELIGRAVAAPQGVTRTPRTQLVITMTYQALTGQLQGAGIAGNDETLPAGTVRRLACEAGIIPMVLGGPSQVLDLGYTRRYFTPAQRLALALRDGGCSYPGCTVPPQWCEAHHVVPWSQGGPTDLSNGVLLCGRHHTRVHELGLTAQVTPEGVTWHPPPPPQHRPSHHDDPDAGQHAGEHAGQHAGEHAGHHSDRHGDRYGGDHAGHHSDRHGDRYGGDHAGHHAPARAPTEPRPG
jgi:hypothetical protein